MGFDLYGVDPVDKKGEYFRNNCWWWRALWDYVSKTCKGAILTAEDIKRGNYNDGHEIDVTKAKAIAGILKTLLHKGIVKKYEHQYMKSLKDMPDVECELCGGTGKRNDAIVKGKCNGCGGKGTRRPWETSYPFEVSNVKEFAEFCEKSGGFTIC